MLYLERLSDALLSYLMVSLSIDDIYRTSDVASFT